MKKGKLITIPAFGFSFLYLQLIVTTPVVLPGPTCYQGSGGAGSELINGAGGEPGHETYEAF